MDPSEIEDLEHTLGMLAACRNFAGEMAMNELTTRIHTDVQTFLDHTTTSILDSLRNAPDVDRGLKIAQIEAALRFSAKVFGPSYAQLLQKAADVAILSSKAPQR
jgi:hypothetical protein